MQNNKTSLGVATSSHAWVVQESENTYSKNGNTPYGIASITKLLTAYTAIKYFGDFYNKIVVINDSAAKTKGSSAGLATGDQVAFNDLMYAMLLPSGNDAAIAIAEHTGSVMAKEDGGCINAISRFIQEMNSNARDLGLESFRIFDVHGLGKNVGTAADVLTLGKAVIKIEALKVILSTNEYSAFVENIHGEKKQFVWINTNPILSEGWVCGGKTGRSSYAKSCLFIWAEFDLKNYFCVVMGASDRASSGSDVKALISAYRQNKNVFDDVHSHQEKSLNNKEDEGVFPILWGAPDLERVLFGNWINEGFDNWRATGVSANPLYVSKGDIYFDRQVGEYSIVDRLKLAYRNGAVAAVVDVHPSDFPGSLPVYKVQNNLDSLLYLATVARYRTSANIIAVTGSVGKTGTKDMIFSLLSEFAPAHKSLKSMNDTWGVPVSLSCIPSKINFSIIEAGLMGRARMEKYSRMIAANVVVITSIEDAHLEYHKTKTEIAETKSMLIAKAEAGCVVVLPRDSECFEFLYGKVKGFSNVERVISFGEHKESTVRLVFYEIKPNGMDITVELCGKQFSYFLSLIGVHHVMNSLAAIAAVYATNQDVLKTLQAFKQQKPGFRRGELITINVNGGSALVMDDSWSANPASVRAALKAATHLKKPHGRLIVCLGDMLELGNESRIHHEHLIPFIKNDMVDVFFTVGEMMNEVSEKIGTSSSVRQFSSVKLLGNALKSILLKDDLILVKGSNAMNMWRVVAELKADFTG